MGARTAVRIRKARLKWRGKLAVVAIVALGNLAPSVNWAGSTVAAGEGVNGRARADSVPAARYAPPVNAVARVSGNAASRHAVASIIGGPARYDAKKGAMIGGSMMRHKR